MKEIILKELSSLDIFECDRLAKKLEKDIIKDDMDKPLLAALCEDGTLCFMACYKADDGDKKAFASPLEALTRLSIAELCTLRNEYADQFLRGCRKA